MNVWTVVSAGIKVERALTRVCLYRVPRAIILDKLLGPAEEFEFVGATTPIEPPDLS